MKKGKSRNKRKKTRSRLLWIAIAVIGIAAVISAVCVAGMLETKENAWRTPEELLVEYMYHIPKKEYEEMYAMLHVEASGSISQEDFIKRNSAIYEGIEVQNIPNRKEYEEGWYNLEKADFQVDYILTHSGPREVVAAMGYGEMSDDEVELRQYLQRVADNTDFTAWYFGHFHEDTEVEEMFYCLYDDIVVL